MCFPLFRPKTPRTAFLNDFGLSRSLLSNAVARSAAAQACDPEINHRLSQALKEVAQALASQPTPHANYHAERIAYMLGNNLARRRFPLWLWSTKSIFLTHGQREQKEWVLRVCHSLISVLCPESNQQRRNWQVRAKHLLNSLESYSACTSSTHHTRPHHHPTRLSLNASDTLSARDVSFDVVTTPPEAGKWMEIEFTTRKDDSSHHVDLCSLLKGGTASRVTLVLKDDMMCKTQYRGELRHCVRPGQGIPLSSALRNRDFTDAQRLVISCAIARGFCALHNSGVSIGSWSSEKIFVMRNEKLLPISLWIALPSDQPDNPLEELCDGDLSHNCPPILSLANLTLDIASTWPQGVDPLEPPGTSILNIGEGTIANLVNNWYSEIRLRLVHLENQASTV